MKKKLEPCEREYWNSFGTDERDVKRYEQRAKEILTHICESFLYLKDGFAHVDPKRQKWENFDSELNTLRRVLEEMAPLLLLYREYNRRKRIAGGSGR